MFRPISSQNSYNQNWNEVNNMVRKLNKEQTVKTFKNGSNNAIIQGRLPNGKYGILVYEGTTARVLIGQSPDDTYGIWVSKEGEDVLEAFS